MKKKVMQYNPTFFWGKQYLLYIVLSPTHRHILETSSSKKYKD